MSKKLITVVSLVLTLVFIASFILIFNSINNMAKTSNNQITQVKSSIGNQRIESLNGARISGAEVKDLINNYRETPEGIKMSYLVLNCSKRSGTTGQTSYGWGGIVHSTTSSGYYAITSSYESMYMTYKDVIPTNINYIGDNYTYSCTVVNRTTDNTIVHGIVFYREV